MDLLQNIVFPQSPTNILLLKYLLFLTLLLLLPYLSVLISSTLFSIMHFNKGNSTGNRIYLKFANELVDLFTINKGMSFTLGIVPFISITFIFAQLLLNSDLNLTSHLFFALLLLIAALVSVYTYKYSFRLKNIFNLINIKDIEEEKFVANIEGFKKSNSKLLSKSGLIGFLLLISTAYILIGVLQIITNNSQWSLGANFSTIIFSANTILYFVFYLTFSFAITCAAIIYKYFKVESVENNNEYLSYVKNFALKTGLIFTFIQPFLFVIAFLSSPKGSLSFELFVISFIVLGLMLAVSIMFYIMYRESKTDLGSSTVLVFLILLSAIIYKDQLAFDTAIEKQIIIVNNDYNLFVDKIKEEAGIEEIVVINGEDIYNAKCIACHRFDLKLVGPAYNDVLPKYEGNQAGLVDFILNPVKINPDFTAMPNQGLKPKEAAAIAEYIIKIYKGE